MKLIQLIRKIAEVAKSQPNVGLVVDDGDIYRINELNDVKYPAIAIGQEMHTYSVSDDTITFNFILYYADRLKADESNKTMVQSNAVDCIRNILLTLNDDDDIDIDVNTVNINVFTQKFNDVCAGCYCNISITDIVDSCYEEYED